MNRSTPGGWVTCEGGVARLSMCDSPEVCGLVKLFFNKAMFLYPYMLGDGGESSKPNSGLARSLATP